MNWPFVEAGQERKCLEQLRRHAPPQAIRPPHLASSPPCEIIPLSFRDSRDLFTCLLPPLFLGVTWHVTGNRSLINIKDMNDLLSIVSKITRETVPPPPHPQSGLVGHLVPIPIHSSPKGSARNSNLGIPQGGPHSLVLQWPPLIQPIQPGADGSLYTRRGGC